MSLILRDVDEAAIAPFLSADTTQFEVLRQWVAQRGDPDIRSEAGALRALLHAGVEALRDDVLDAGYAELAAEFHGDTERAERRTARDRYAARTDTSL
ncbi:MAG TPA: hypothetical protein VIW24_00035 [Aldersonia sp.]